MQIGVSPDKLNGGGSVILLVIFRDSVVLKRKLFPSSNSKCE